MIWTPELSVTTALEGPFSIVHAAMLRIRFAVATTVAILVRSGPVVLWVFTFSVLDSCIGCIEQARGMQDDTVTFFQSQPFDTESKREGWLFLSSAAGPLPSSPFYLSAVFAFLALTVGDAGNDESAPTSIERQVDSDSCDAALEEALSLFDGLDIDLVREKSVALTEAFALWVTGTESF